MFHVLWFWRACLSARDSGHAWNPRGTHQCLSPSPTPCGSSHCRCTCPPMTALSLLGSDSISGGMANSDSRCFAGTKIMMVKHQLSIGNTTSRRNDSREKKKKNTQHIIKIFFIWFSWLDIQECIDRTETFLVALKWNCEHSAINSTEYFSPQKLVWYLDDTESNDLEPWLVLD